MMHKRRRKAKTKNRPAASRIAKMMRDGTTRSHRSAQPTTPMDSTMLNPKIQDELIAREIVINDAESSVRYKLTKRQTQEEIQRCTGAVVITRGKYRAPNASTDGEKPLYLHISAGAHIKETTERILAVDRAAAMVEEMLKQGQNLQPSSSSFLSTMSDGLKELSTCVYLGFDSDPSLNIAARIRGPSVPFGEHRGVVHVILSSEICNRTTVSSTRTVKGVG